MRQLIRFLCVGSLLVSLSGSFAMADVTMVWRTIKEGSTMRVEFVDKNNMRLTVGPESAFYVLGKKQYMASRKGGQWRVIDMSAMRAQMKKIRERMAAMIQQRGGKAPPGMMADGGRSARSSAARNVRVTATGEKETVGGVTGEIYRVVDDTPGAKSTRVTLTDDPRVARAWRGWREAMAVVGSLPGGRSPMFSANGAMAKVITKNLAPIRVEGEMELLSISDGKIEPSRLKLPARPSAMPEMPAGFGR